MTYPNDPIDWRKVAMLIAGAVAFVAVVALANGCASPLETRDTYWKDPQHPEAPFTYTQSLTWCRSAQRLPNAECSQAQGLPFAATGVAP